MSELKPNKIEETAKAFRTDTPNQIDDRVDKVSNEQQHMNRDLEPEIDGQSVGTEERNLEVKKQALERERQELEIRMQEAKIETQEAEIEKQEARIKIRKAERQWRITSRFGLIGIIFVIILTIVDKII